MIYYLFFEKYSPTFLPLDPSKRLNTLSSPIFQRNHTKPKLHRKTKVHVYPEITQGCLPRYPWGTSDYTSPGVSTAQAARPANTLSSSGRRSEATAGRDEERPGHPERPPPWARHWDIAPGPPTEKLRRLTARLVAFSANLTNIWLFDAGVPTTTATDPSACSILCLTCYNWMGNLCRWYLTNIVDMRLLVLLVSNTYLLYIADLIYFAGAHNWYLIYIGYIVNIIDIWLVMMICDAFCSYLTRIGDIWHILVISDK